MMKSKQVACILFAIFISNAAFAEPVGTWDLISPSPMGDMPEVLVLRVDGSGSLENQMGKAEFMAAKIDGNNFEFTVTVNSPMGEMQLQYSGDVDGDKLNGTLETPMGPAPFSGSRSK